MFVDSEAAHGRARLAKGMTLADIGQRVLAFYLAEMDEGRLYQASGHSCTAHYAEERLGLDRRSTGELVEVGKQLETLPAIDVAFCKREIGWSKVLLLVSVATPEPRRGAIHGARAGSVTTPRGSAVAALLRADAAAGSPGGVAHPSRAA